MARDMNVTRAWAQPLTWPEVQLGERIVRLSAGPDELAKIRRELELEALESLEADLTFRPWLDGVEIDGRLNARATQLCGVTLEPFDVMIDEPIRLRIVPTGSPNAPRSAEGEVVIDLDAEDPPDEAASASIDLAAYVVESLALALDPFPRKPGAVFVAPEITVSLSPFAALSRLAARPSED